MFSLVRWPFKKKQKWEAEQKVRYAVSRSMKICSAATLVKLELFVPRLPASAPCVPGGVTPRDMLVHNVVSQMTRRPSDMQARGGLETVFCKARLPE